MNSNLLKCAVIELYHGQFKIIEPGDYVLCSITKEKIPLENLKYWLIRKKSTFGNSVFFSKTPIN